MNRDRFDEIMQHIHLNDNENLDVTDEFSKVHPLLLARWGGRLRKLTAENQRMKYAIGLQNNTAYIRVVVE